MDNVKKNDNEDVILEYWNQHENVFPNITDFCEIFGERPKKICDILFKGFDVLKCKHTYIYFIPGSEKIFMQNPLRYVLDLDPYTNEFRVIVDETELYSCYLPNYDNKKDYVMAVEEGGPISLNDDFVF